MSDREAFEKWWPSVGQTIGKVAAWEAWQAAQAQTLLEVIRDTTGCPTKALQSGEPVAWMSPNKQSLEFSRPDTVYGSHTIPLYTTPQPVVPVKHIVIDSNLLIALLSTSHPDGTFKFDYRGISKETLQDVFEKALLSAGKETV
jgi:hypothetical protein